MTEIFTYLGRQAQESGSVHGFLHTQVTSMTTDAILEMAGGLMNSLIHEEFIERDDKVLVFNLLPEKESILPVLVDHVNFRPIEFPPASVADFLSRLVKADRSADTDLLVVKTTLHNGRPVMYETYLVEKPEDLNNIKTTLKRIGDSEMPTVEPLRYCLTQKHIPYLNKD